MTGKTLLTNLFSNALFLLSRSDVDRALSEADMTSNSNKYYSRLITEPPAELERICYGFNETDALEMFAVLLWRMKNSGLVWDSTCSNLVRALPGTRFSPSHVMNALRLGYEYRNAVKEVDLLLSNWPAVYAEVKLALSADSGTAHGITCNIGWALAAYTPCFKTSDMWPSIRDLLVHWIHKSKVDFETIGWDIGSLLVVMSDLGIGNDSAWAFIVRYAEGYPCNALTGFDVAGLVAGRRLFGEKIDAVFDKLSASLEQSRTDEFAGATKVRYGHVRRVAKSQGAWEALDRS